MKSATRRYLLLLFIAAILASCERKPISEDCACSTTLAIPIDINWAISNIEAQNVTALFYNISDGSLQYEHIYENNNNDIQSYAYLPEGSYTVVIFNELRDQIDYLSCVGYGDISTLKFESTANDPLRARSGTRSYIEQSGDLAVAVVEDVIVSEDMIVELADTSYETILSNSSTKSLSTETRATIESLTNVVAVKKNVTINITAHFDNIYYARMPALVDLVNLSDGYFVLTDENSTTTSTLQFTMNNRTYDSDSAYNGTISTTISSFGTLGDRLSTSGHDQTTPVTLDVLFQQIDEDYTEVSYALDVTSSITHTLADDGTITIDIDAIFTDPLPVVTPAGASDGDSGFGSSVDDWGTVSVTLDV